jgi:hypothetical protein
MTLNVTDGAEVALEVAGTEATPEVKMSKPIDPYSTDWLLYNFQAPREPRSVGAASAEEAAGEEGGGEEGDGDEGTDGGDGVKEEQKRGEHFSDAFADEDVRKQASRYTTEEAMAKALREANVELSQRIKIPDEGADDEAVAAYRKSIGVPDDIKGYDLKKPEHMDQAVYDDPNMQSTINGIVEHMHAAGASKKVVNSTMDAYWAIEASAADLLAKNDIAASEAAEAGLRKDWNKNYDANMAFANQVIGEHPDLGQLELKDGTLVGSSPYFAKVFAELGRLKQEGGMHLGLVNTEAGVDLKTEHGRLTNEIAIAHTKGDKITAERLDTERDAISKKLFGEGPISGQGV